MGDGIPAHVQEEIEQHLNAIGALFKRPKVTLIVRNPDLGDGDLVLTSDEPAAAIRAMQRLIDRANPAPNPDPTIGPGGALREDDAHG